MASKTNLISEGECGTSNLIGTSVFMFGTSRKKEKERKKQTRPMPGADTGEGLPRVTGCYADLEVRAVFQQVFGDACVLEGKKTFGSHASFTMALG